jgi:hypothetical protein
MLAASPLPPILAPTGAPATPLPSPALAQAPAMAHITYYAPPPALASNALLNQRQPQVQQNSGSQNNAPALALPRGAVLSSAGLQPAAYQPVQREFGYSSAFMAQWIDQASGGGSAAIDIKYMPSSAAKPIEIPPMQELVSRIASLRQQVPQQAPSVVQAMQQIPTRSAAELLSAPQAIQFNVGQMSTANAVHQQASAAIDVLTRVSASSTGSAGDARGTTPFSTRSARVREAAQAYAQATARLKDLPKPQPVQEAPDAPIAPIAAIEVSSSRAPSSTPSEPAPLPAVTSPQSALV